MRLLNLFGQSKDPKKLAAKAQQSKDPQKAVSLYTDAIQYAQAAENPDSGLLSDLYLLRGEVYMGQGVALLSSSDFLHALEYNPENGIAHNDLGVWFMMEQFAAPDHARAQEHFNKAVEYCPDRRDFRMNRAIATYKLGQKDQGLAELEQLYQEGFADAKNAMDLFCT